MCYNVYSPEVDIAKGTCFLSDNPTQKRVLFRAQKPSEGGEIMGKLLVRGKEKLTNAYWSAVGMASVALLSVSPVLAADTIWSRFSTILKDIYGEVVAISTIVAVTVGAIALLIRMISRNNRAVEEATNWLKRIVVTWIILNSLGFVVAYLQPLIQGGNYSP